ncbi:hypothetical protein [Alicyclobacillus sp. SO9]|uniref:hypothetical protein n=1 Tax=Alicyclobacillus sp. SO9 TaxID=2665646 RepID=UPI0018E8C17E|nr:hypothetical protein [Alicyclobacillus sp. SO9]QQE78941.1 hypothetical protein GI364_24450 [Alicyclobacillus sp. SO9]
MTVKSKSGFRKAALMEEKSVSRETKNATVAGAQPVLFGLFHLLSHFSMAQHVGCDIV